MHPVDSQQTKKEVKVQSLSQKAEQPYIHV